MVSYDRVLPIGSVVLLKGASRRLMILGYRRYSADSDNKKIFDYCGCPFPQGFISPEKTAIFDHEDIDRIIAIGLQNEEGIVFSEKLRKIIEKNTQQEEASNDNPDGNSETIKN